MVSCEEKSIADTYKVLLSELKKYNPDLVTKKRILAITKSDLIDDELEAMLKKELPKKVQVVFISAHTGKNITKLKDMLWKAITEA